MTNNKSFIAGIVVANLLVLLSSALGWDKLNYGVSAIGIALLGTAIMSSVENNTSKTSIKLQRVSPQKRTGDTERPVTGRRDARWRTLAAVIGFIIGGV
jgi:hypothetical protein